MSLRKLEANVITYNYLIILWFLHFIFSQNKVQYLYNRPDTGQPRFPKG